MSFDFKTELTVLSAEGPVLYLSDECRAARDRFACELPATATAPDLGASAGGRRHPGLIPPCWR